MAGKRRSGLKNDRRAYCICPPPKSVASQGPTYINFEDIIIYETDKNGNSYWSINTSLTISENQILNIPIEFINVVIPLQYELINNGIINNNATLNNNTLITNNGTINNIGTITNNGTINNNGIINNDGTINNGTITNNGTINNDGTINTYNQIYGTIIGNSINILQIQ